MNPVIKFIHGLWIHNTESLESQLLGHFDLSQCHDLKDKMQRVMHPSISIEIITEQDEQLEG